MTDSSENDKSQDDKSRKIIDEDLGYSFYPERKAAFEEGEPEFVKKKKMRLFLSSITEGKTRNSDETKTCEKYVMWCTRNHPGVKLVISALKAKGCPVNLRRHISCESCYQGVNGGFDSKTNQIVLCENNVNQYIVCAVMSHELIHAFDKCRTKLDLNNLQHIACTEIRAAALTGCSYRAAWNQGDMTFNNFRKSHRRCVESQAIESVRAVRNISWEEAARAVLPIFDKCYNDTEPYGRIPQRRGRDMDQILSEGLLLGYIPPSEK